MLRERISTWPHDGANRWAVLTEDLGGSNRTLTAIEVDSYNAFFLDPNGNVTVTLPAEEGSEGAYLVIFNTAGAAETITVENDAAATVGTIAQDEAALFGCNGTVWRSLVGPNT